MRQVKRTSPNERNERTMALFTQADINAEIWTDREFILSQRYPEDSAHEYADGSVPVYTANIQLDWADLDFEHQNRWKEMGYESPETIEDLQKVDIYLYYFDLYSGAISELVNDKVLINGEWLPREVSTADMNHIFGGGN